MKTALVLGGSGFIGSHMVTRLQKDGYWVRSVDLKCPDYGYSKADDMIIGDLRQENLVSRVMFAPSQISIKDKENSFDEVYSFAADMGGAGYVFTGEHDADIMHNSALINLHVAKFAALNGVKKLFYSSSACAYPQHIQEETDNQGLKESDAIPAAPDSVYGWEKLFSEFVYDSFHRNKGLDIRIARFHNIFGIEGTYDGDRAKAPAAICRKVAQAKDGDTIEIWGDGLQTRSFLYVDECIEGILRLMDSEYRNPINIGSDEMISINDLAKMVIEISGKDLKIKNVESNAIGVRGRNSENTLIEQVLGWRPTQPLRIGIEKTYAWVNEQVNRKANLYEHKVL